MSAPTEDRETVVCRDCDGFGEHIHDGPGTAGTNSAGYPYPTQRVERCRTCEGRGWVPAED